MKFILWFIIIVLVIRMVRKNIFISVQRSFNQQMKNQMDDQNQYPKKPEGTVTIEKETKKSIKEKNRDDGDFIDYEELK